MSFTRASYTKDWENPTDFPTIETSEAQVRADIQILYTQIKTALNNLMSELENAGAGNLGISGISGISATDIQGALEEIEQGQQTHTTNIATLIKNVTLNSATGVMTFTKFDDSTFTIDTDLEKVVTNFRYDQTTQSLILTYPDGTEVSISLSSFISEYDFENSADIQFTVTNHKVVATITSSYKSDIVAAKEDAEDARDAAQGYASQASSYATNASGLADAAALSATAASGSATDAADSATAAAGSASSASSSSGTAIDAAGASAASATLAESYAKGGTGTRTGENTDNAKYYKEEAERIVGEAGLGDMLKSSYDTTNTGNKVDTALNAEKLNGELPSYYADQGDISELQSQIDAIASKSDVVDIVATKADLDDYDTSTLLENDVIKVLADETHSGAIAYYRWTGTAFNYIGSQGPYYTISETDTLLGGKANLQGGKVPSTEISGLGYVTTAPTANNTDGIKIAVLSSEPSTKYNGWLYLITG